MYIVPPFSITIGYIVIKMLYIYIILEKVKIFVQKLEITSKICTYIRTYGKLNERDKN